ncbi:MAG TPA: tRNA uridine-5-carboxymethylaminomethyl(34) synthesis GTPase MnmE, partial [Sphingomicrobium sp.]|nr:tRNA uridine-5-carboxymethylaminomethyl(34) synthesis GTPase MnmE [Sphingomicrobium sp.]
ARGEAERAELLLWLGAASEAPDRPGVILIAAKADLGNSAEGLPVSAVTGQGNAELMRALVEQAKQLLPKADELALDRRQHDLLAESQAALHRAAELEDPVLMAEELRVARLAIDRISGRAGVEDLLDALFGRFCLGK